MRYLRCITRQHPTQAQVDGAFQKVGTVQAIIGLLVVLQDLGSKEETNAS